MASLVMALDQGTTSSRAILFDHDSCIKAVAQLEFPQVYPQPGWVEHDPQAIWDTQIQVARKAMESAGASSSDIAAIGITNQRETTIVWDKETGQPVYNAIVWQCRRTAALCDELKEEGFDTVIREKTGLVTDAYFSGTKLAWLLDNVPGARSRAESGKLAFGTVDTFLIWRLTGGELHITDVSNASRTMLFNIYTLDWDDEILARLGVPRSMLPAVRPSSQLYGYTDPSIFGKHIPIAGIAGDQQAATFGQTCFSSGMAKNTYGTGCFMLLNTGEAAAPSEHGLLTTVGWQVGKSPVVYMLEGSVFIAGAAVQWLRDGLGIIKNSSDVETLARTEDDNGGVYLAPAFVGLGAPHWDPYARGALMGLTRGTTAGHVARATLESIAYQTRDVMEAMEADSNLTLDTLRADGGATHNSLLMQFQADILGVPVEVPVISETTALGAAYLAGLAVDYWTDEKELISNWSVARRYMPSMDNGRREKLYAGWKKAIDRTRQWID
ncbi:MAG: glycerol kinase GlpK [Anaerolineales bacterium]|nr:glycerol kinase GlpK [Anaerolineales bacterium]